MAPTYEQTNVRLPAALKSYINEQAAAARRSLTAEVVLRLERTRKLDLLPSIQSSAHKTTTEGGQQP